MGCSSKERGAKGNGEAKTLLLETGGRGIVTGEGREGGGN